MRAGATDGPEKGARLSRGRMLLLLSDYLDLTDNRTESVKVLSAIDKTHGLSVREAIFMFGADRNGTLPGGLSKKSSDIKTFMEDYEKGSMSFDTLSEKIRSFSDEGDAPAALLVLLASRDEGRKNALLSALAQWPLLQETLDKACWMDRIRLERMLALRLGSSGETQKAHTYTESLKKEADERDILPLRREAMIRGARELTAMKRYDQAYAMAGKAETFTPRETGSLSPSVRTAGLRDLGEKSRRRNGQSEKLRENKDLSPPIILRCSVPGRE